MPYDWGSWMCCCMKHPKPDRLVVMLGIPITVHSAAMQNCTKPLWRYEVPIGSLKVHGAALQEQSQSGQILKLVARSRQTLRYSRFCTLLCPAHFKCPAHSVCPLHISWGFCGSVLVLQFWCTQLAIIGVFRGISPRCPEKLSHGHRKKMVWLCESISGLNPYHVFHTATALAQLLNHQTLYFSYGNSIMYVLDVGMRRGASHPCPHLPIPAPSHPVWRATIDRHQTWCLWDHDFKDRCHRDRSGPRVADDSNSQNVNSRLYPVESIIHSVSQSQITVIIMLIFINS